MHAARLAAVGVVLFSSTGCSGPAHDASRAPAPRAAMAASPPSVVSTEYLGPLVGEAAQLDPANLTPDHIAYYGTDLGFSYRHGTRLEFLFGDSWATEQYAPIEASSGARFDDSFGSIDLEAWPDPTRITPIHMPTVRLGQNPGTTEASAIDPGHAMDLGKTPMGGFSAGDAEFGIFNITKPRACASDADCSDNLACDTTFGYFGVRASVEESLTLPCRDGSPACTAATMVDDAGAPVPDSGFCADPSSVLHGGAVSNLLNAAGLRVRIGLRDAANPKKYGHVHDWLTNKFMNVTVRTVERFDPATAADRGRQDYRPATGTGGKQRAFLWGRPGFVGVAAHQRSLPLYFAWVDLPTGPGYTWQPHYFTGVVDGVPQFSTGQRAAAPADLDATRDGVQAAEPIDIVNQMSVAWVEPLAKWVMFYGGGLSTLPMQTLPACGVTQLFAGAECTAVVTGNGAVRMRTADQPWGPWSPPADVIVGGNPADGPRGQYGPGGALRHPDCADPTCAPPSTMFAYQAGEYGFFYSANIISEWVQPVGDGVDILWNASTWDPYRVVLLRTRINR
jgi:hypothetical protein